MLRAAASDRLNMKLRILLNDGAASYQASTVNVSKTDVIVTCAKPLAVGKTIDGVLVLPNGAARVKAEVVWVREAPASKQSHERSTMGLCFVAAPSASYDAWFGEALARSQNRTLPPVVKHELAAKAAAPAAQAKPEATPAGRESTVRGYLPLATPTK
jgi:hypothetical protein